MEKKYQIFISSTYEDLKEERKTVQDTILSMYHFPIGMEMFSAADKGQWEIIKETIESSDYYILIIANRYGTIIENGEDKGISYTEKEYRYAKSKNIPILVFIIDNSVPRLASQHELSIDSQIKLDEFIREVKEGRMVNWWHTKDELALKVINSLNKEIRNSERPGWIRPKIQLNEEELEEMKCKIIELQKENADLKYQSYKLPPMYVEAFDLRKMKYFISQHNIINEVIHLEKEFNESENGHIIYFVNNDKKTKKNSDEFIMLAYIYNQNQNWTKYYYNNYGLFFSIRGSQNINNIQVEIKEKNTSLISILSKKYELKENRKDYCMRIRDIDIRCLSNIKEVCFTIYNDFFNKKGKSEFEVCDIWLKQLPDNL